MRHEVVRTHELDRPEYARNSPDRCFHCKEELFTRLEPIARQAGAAQVIYGANMSAHQMLQRNPRPTEAQIRHDLEGNLCRCTGYHNIVKAIQYAAEQMAGK